MKPVEINHSTPVRRLGNEISRARANEHSRPAMAAAADTVEPAMVAGEGVFSSGDKAPVDTDRVAQIRSALRDGRYPLLPAKLADQMIAAGFVLIDGKDQ